MSGKSAGRRRLSLFKKRARRLDSSENGSGQHLQVPGNGRSTLNEAETGARGTLHGASRTHTGQQKGGGGGRSGEGERRGQGKDGENDLMADIERAEQLRTEQEQRSSSQEERAAATGAFSTSRVELKFLLKVKILSARNVKMGGMLMSADGACDTYVRVKTKNVVRTTSIKKMAKNPAWDEDVVLSVKAHDTVDIVLLENDRYLGDRMLGTLQFSVAEFVNNREAGVVTPELWFNLGDRTKKAHRSLAQGMQSCPASKMAIKIGFEMNTVAEARNLRKASMLEKVSGQDHERKSIASRSTFASSLSSASSWRSERSGATNRPAGESNASSIFLTTEVIEVSIKGRREREPQS